MRQLVDHYTYFILLLAGLCKHLNACMILAAQRGLVLEEARQAEAVNLLQNNSYYHDKDTKEIEVFHQCGLVSQVNVETLQCSCVARSHGIDCICVMLVTSIRTQEGRGVTQMTYQRSPIKEVQQVSLDEQIVQKIEDIARLVKTDSFRLVSDDLKRTILNRVNEVSNLVSIKKYQGLYSRKKHTPIRHYTKKTKVEHPYSQPKKKKTKVDSRNEDGSIRTFGRRKGALRKTFE